MNQQMRKLMRLALLGFALLTGLMCPGCQEPPPAPASIDGRLIQAAQDTQIEAAVVAQHTLYPYHFASGSATLNALGQADLATLARHADQNPCVNLSRGTASDELYKARVETVAAAIARSGAGGLSLAVEQMPGGEGQSSVRAVELLERADALVQPAPARPDSAKGVAK